MFDRIKYYKKKLNKLQLGLAKKFDVLLESKDYSKSTLQNYCGAITFFGKHIKDFKKPTEKELELFFEKLLSRYKASSRISMISNIVMFLDWLEVDEEIIDLLKEHTPRHTGSPVERDHILTEEEIRDLISAEVNPMWKAFFSTTYFGCLRFKEVTGIRLKDISYDVDNKLFEIEIKESKTKAGKRKVFCMENVEILKKWIDIHPNRKNKSSYLFINGKYRTKLTGCLVKWRIGLISKKAGIDKNVYLHLLRHSRCTHLMSSGVPDSIIKKCGGWKNNDMLNVYGHLVDKDVKDYFTGKNGNCKKKEEPLKDRLCWKCNTPNKFNRVFCVDCGVQLDPRELFKKQEKQNMQNKLINILLGDTELKELAKQKVRENKEALNIAKELM